MNCLCVAVNVFIAVIGAGNRVMRHFIRKGIFSHPPAEILMYFFYKALILNIYHNGKNDEYAEHKYQQDDIDHAETEQVGQFGYVGRIEKCPRRYRKR